MKSIIKRVGEVLEKYRSGWLPWSLHAIPLLESWEELIKITKPDKWSPAAYFEAVRIFTSKTESAWTLSFFKNYLLPWVLADINENWKLNYHLFRALQKALYRPASFFRGILGGFLANSSSTLKQA